MKCESLCFDGSETIPYMIFHQMQTNKIKYCEVPRTKLFRIDKKQENCFKNVKIRQS